MNGDTRYTTHNTCILDRKLPSGNRCRKFRPHPAFPELLDAGHNASYNNETVYVNSYS